MLFGQDQAPPPPPGLQQSAPPSGGWRKVGDPAPNPNAANVPADQAADEAAPPDIPEDAAPPEQAGPPDQAPPANPPASANPPARTYPNPPPQRRTMDPNYGQSPMQYPDQPRAGYSAGYSNRPIPGHVTLKAGTFVTVRLNQGLSSDRNQQGDAFSATLVKPVIVDGVVVADRGQTVGGHVVEAKKAGRVQGVSRLGVQLTDLTLADGQVVPLQSQFVSRNGPTSVGRDVAAVGTTTGVGAAIGAAAGWGTGAAIGAGAGALAGIVGVLLTRGRPTVLYPESVLTFRIEAPVAINTEAASQAFRWVNPGDYDRPQDMQMRTGPPAGYPPYGAYPYPYSYWGPGYYWGPGVYFGGLWGRGWGYGGWGYGGFGYRGFGWRR
jgi:hypothetical protein